MSDKQRIIIKGSTWLFNRLDTIGFKGNYRELMKQIWCYEKVDRKLLKQIVSDKHEAKDS